jgi:NodT family efflux transporter outer membrane factor (OMF) lipoprotein
LDAFQRVLIASSILMLAACASASPPVAELTALPAAYDYADPAGAPAPEAAWWRGFGDPALDALVGEALLANQDLAAGVARVRQARASLKTATSSLFPQVSAGASANSNSDDGFGDVSGSSRANASYQLDLFGENRAGRKAAKEGLKGQIYSQRALELTVQSDVAFAYFSINALRSQLEVAQSNLDISERIYDIVRVRYEAGDVSGFDIASQEAQLANARARIPQLDQQLVAAETALAVLLGRAPQGYGAPAGDILALAPPAVDPGLPSELLLRRPDLLAAEASLRAADANVTAARAAFFPSIDLSSGVTAALTGGASVVGSLAASLSAPIFTGGRLEGNLEGAKARVDERIAGYRQATLNALRDVDVSLRAVKTAGEREDQLEIAKEAAGRSLTLAEIRYRSGADDLTSLLNAQSTFFNASDSLVQGRLDRLTAASDLFVALGGGWGAEDNL